MRSAQRHQHGSTTESRIFAEIAHFVIEMLSESSGARLISALLIRKALRANGCGNETSSDGVPPEDENHHYGITPAW